VACAHILQRIRNLRNRPFTSIQFASILINGALGGVFSGQIYRLLHWMGLPFWSSELLILPCGFVFGYLVDLTRVLNKIPVLPHSIVPKDMRDGFFGDLAQRREVKEKQFGNRIAARWYWKQILTSCAPLLVLTLRRAITKALRSTR
jgi:hypothetical protein